MKLMIDFITGHWLTGDRLTALTPMRSNCSVRRT